MGTWNDRITRFICEQGATSAQDALDAQLAEAGWKPQGKASDQLVRHFHLRVGQISSQTVFELAADDEGAAIVDQLAARVGRASSCRTAMLRESGYGISYDEWRDGQCSIAWDEGGTYATLIRKAVRQRPTEQDWLDEFVGVHVGSSGTHRDSRSRRGDHPSTLGHTCGSRSADGAAARPWVEHDRHYRHRVLQPFTGAALCDADSYFDGLFESLSAAQQVRVKGFGRFLVHVDAQGQSNYRFRPSPLLTQAGHTSVPIRLDHELYDVAIERLCDDDADVALGHHMLLYKSKIPATQGINPATLEVVEVPARTLIGMIFRSRP